MSIPKDLSEVHTNSVDGITKPGPKDPVLGIKIKRSSCFSKRLSIHSRISPFSMMPGSMLLVMLLRVELLLLWNGAVF